MSTMSCATIYARSPLAREKGYKAGDFSYNTGRLRCPGCDGTGTISLDIQFLPDVEITCPDCGGSRYQKDAAALYRTRKDGTQAESLPRLMEMSVDEALAACADLKLVASRLQTLSNLGLGYLTLGEATPSLSGGEAQRLKLASEMGQRAGRHRVCIRRAHHRPAPAGCAYSAGRVPASH